MKLPVYNLKGDKLKEKEIGSRIFGVKVKSEVVHQVVVAQNAGTHIASAHAKDKGEVRGGGKKPWRQKGTGRARHGSIRSPLWRGGGVTFGPNSTRNFVKQVNKKQKQLALAMCLSDKLAGHSLVIFDKLELTQGKTKELKNWLSEIRTKLAELKKSKKFLLVLDSNDQKMINAALNLDGVNTIMANSLNCVEILKADSLLASEKAIEIIESHYHQIKEKKVK